MAGKSGQNPQSKGTPELGGYLLLAGILVLGFAITVLFSAITKEPDTPFLEAYFNDHKSLPQRVEPFEEYNFSVGFRSTGGDGSAQRYSVNLELYKLYDVTEGTYNCRSQFRDKTHMRWTLLNETEQPMLAAMFGQERMEQFVDLWTVYVEDEVDHSINMGEYIIDIPFRFASGMGELDIVSWTGERAPFYISIGRDGVVTVFTAGEERSFKAEFTEGNTNTFSAEISEDTINVSVNGEVLGSVSPGTTLEQGRIILITRNLAVDLREFSVFRSGDINPLDSLNYLEYKIESSAMMDLNSKLKALKERKVEAQIAGFEPERDLITPMLDEIGVEYMASSLPSYMLVLENASDLNISYARHAVSVSYETSSGDGTYVLTGYGKDNETLFALLIHEGLGLTALYQWEGGIVRYQTRHKELVRMRKHDVALVFSDDNLTVGVDGEIMFVMEEGYLASTRLDFEMMNTRPYIYSFRIASLDERCDDPLYFDVCSYALDIRGQYRPRNVQEAAVQQGANLTSHMGLRGVNLQNLMGVFEGAGAGVMVPVGDNGSDEASNQTLIFTSYDEIRLLGSLLGKEIPYNPTITDSFISFDGYMARVRNWPTHEFGMSYATLEGARIVSVGFAFQDEDILKVVIAEGAQEIIIFYNDTYQIVPINTTIGNWTEFNIVTDGNLTSIVLEKRQEAVNLSGLDLSNGYYYVSSINTYAHFKHVGVYNPIIHQRKLLIIEEDPCRLRKISDERIGEGLIDITQGDEQRLIERFTIETPFDYGLINVSLDETNRSVHYWFLST
ncbi:hypothetical protein JXB02_02215 [Candidatus Woesearchaeota archaeon]|nr:hypothetical protein [Candidatus Woesearchaeota archaeon]